MTCYTSFTCDDKRPFTDGCKKKISFPACLLTLLHNLIKRNVCSTAPGNNLFLQLVTLWRELEFKGKHASLRCQRWPSRNWFFSLRNMEISRAEVDLNMTELEIKMLNVCHGLFNVAVTRSSPNLFYICMSHIKSLWTNSLGSRDTQKENEVGGNTGLRYLFI